MNKYDNLTQEFTHHVKKQRSNKNKRSLKKLIITCIFITIAIAVIVGLAIGINAAKNS